MDMKDVVDLKTEYILAKEQAEIAAKALEADELELVEAIRRLQLKFARDHYNQLAKREKAVATANEAEEKLRAAVVEICKASGEKTFDEHLSVRETVKLNYAADTAVLWAKKNAPIMVVESVEKKQFEAFAKAQMTETDDQFIKGADLGFVRIEKTVSAVIKGL